MIDLSVPKFTRFEWPKRLPPLSREQKEIADDFVRYWHEILPQHYGVAESFNHTYPLRSLPQADHFRTIELGAGLGGHLDYEPLERQEYCCVELRDNMASKLRDRFPSVTVITADCQEQLPYPDASFDRAVVVHVLEHLPKLPCAIGELARVVRPGGAFSAVLPCDPGLAYALARKISAERIFRARYGIPYAWFYRREHINSPAEILHVIQEKFEILDLTYFPLRIPSINLNLCIGVTARRLGEASLYG